MRAVEFLSDAVNTSIMVKSG